MSYQRVECAEGGCGFVQEGPTALMLGQKHANDKGHEVFWTQEHTGVFSPE